MKTILSLRLRLVPKKMWGKENRGRKMWGKENRGEKWKEKKS